MKFESPRSNIEGEGFIMKEETPSRPKSDISVEFRPGESTDSALAEREKKRDIEMKRIENFTAADHMEEFIRPLATNGKIYSETLLVKPDGTFDTQTRGDGMVPMMSTLGEVTNQNELYMLAKEIQDKHPKYKISFEKDREGKWIKYSIIEVRL